jgi:hypothetical protein
MGELIRFWVQRSITFMVKFAKKRTFMTLFRKICTNMVLKLNFFLQNIMLAVVTRQIRYVTHMCDVTCTVTEAKYGVFRGF